MKKPNNKIGSWTQIGDVVGAVVADLRLKKEMGAVPEQRPSWPVEEDAGMEMQLMQGAARAQSAPTRAAALYMNCTETVH